MKYTKPSFTITNFSVTETVAACDRIVTGTQTTTTYDKQEVYCVIGKQHETVFNTASGCSTSASKWGIATSGEKNYFVWYTYSGDTGSGGKPDDTQAAFLEGLVTSLGFAAGSGWHYCEVTGTDIITDVLGFSY